MAAAQRLHPLAILLSVGGLIPFVVFGLAAVSPIDEPPAHQALLGLIGYGGVILSFVGAVHWGLAIAGYADPIEAGRVMRLRLALGVVPALVGWAALLIALATPFSAIALGLLIAGFLGVILVEARARRDRLIPGGYMGMRWTITVCVLAVLATVLVLRLLGSHVML